MSGIYYDPYDFEIDADPHPIWRRMREEAPLYRHEKYEFWALSRYEDVVAGLTDWRTFSSARGTLLELIRHDVQFPPGMMIFEDPPLHGVHRALMARVEARRGELCCFLIFTAPDPRDARADSLFAKAPRFTPRTAIAREESHGVERGMKESA